MLATPNAFYERGIGTIVNGNNLANGYRPASRPSALYLTADLATAGAGTAGWLEADYGGGGNLVAMTVHGQCSHRTTNSCMDSAQSNLTTRRAGLRTGCRCVSEQHYVYRWDELNRLHEARRYDRTNEAAWTLAARQRYRYDSANQRTVKQTLSLTDPIHRAALYVYPGDYERRGLEADPDGDTWDALADTETQYLIAGARVVWQNRNTVGPNVNPDQRVNFAVTNLIQSTSAVVDLVTGELIEASGYYPNGAREESLSANAQVPLEPSGFTGKEADEEVGLAYFGHRYLVQRIGRWTAPDPLSVHSAGGGEAGNAYHYISGNLLQARDPLGLECGSDCSCMENNEVGAPNYNQVNGEAVNVASPSQTMPERSHHFPNGPPTDPATTRLVHEERLAQSRLEGREPAGDTSRAIWKLPHRAEASDRIKDVYMDSAGGRLTLTPEEMKDVGEGLNLRARVLAPDSRSLFETLYKSRPPSMPSQFSLQLEELRAQGGGDTYVEGRVLHEASEGGTLGRYTVRYSGVLTAGEEGSWNFQGYMSFHDTWDFEPRRDRDTIAEIFTWVGSLMPGAPLTIDSEVVPIEQSPKDVQVRWVDDVKAPSYNSPSFR